MNLTECEERLYDTEQGLTKAAHAAAAIFPVFQKAINLAELEPQIIESMIEAANYPNVDRDRLRAVGTALDELIAAVRKWQAEHQKS